ncbi:MAG: LacI family transcriptional regulator [Bacteroidales bacterium]|nr:LacI family transcriptional regulator [Bacteroidales bacterium]
MAREAGVSTTVVSKVMNAKRLPNGRLDCETSESTAQRVMEVVKRLDYHPSRVAAGLRKGKRFVIGVITPDISEGAFSEAGKKIEEAAYKDGYTVMFGSSNENAGRLRNLMRAFCESGIDGLILTPCEGSEEIIHCIMEKKIPLVLCNRDIPGLADAGCVHIDNKGSIKMAVDHLYGNGYRKIEMISENMKVSSLDDREKSYTETMEAYGLKPYIYRTDEKTVEEDTFRCVREAAEKGTEAIICPRILQSLYSLKAIKRLGLRIPEDMAIFCHDDNPVFNLCHPTVSYISQCASEVGEEAYKMLKRMMDGEAGGKIVISPKVFFGDSTEKTLVK